MFGSWHDFPELHGLTRIKDAALDMRLSIPSPMGGLFPQNWSDIMAYSESNPMISEHWERSLLFSMSEAYVLEYSNGTNPLRLAPVLRHKRAQAKEAGSA